MPELLDSTQRQDALENLIGWSEADNGKAITKIFEFKNFKQAFGFMSQEFCSKGGTNGPPPEWSNVYNKVDVTLSTHDGGVTELDIQLAAFMDDVFN